MSQVAAGGEAGTGHLGGVPPLAPEMLFVGYPDPMPPVAPPKPTRGERMRARQQAKLDNGRHPLNNLPLANNGHTCGDCVHRYYVRYASSYPKCDLGPNTRGEATDVRARWPACISWEPT